MAEQGADNFTEVDFNEIERLYVSGSNQDDLLIGTYINFDSVRAYSNETVRGSDILNGLGGNDLLIGNSGSDFLYGGDGNDILIGADPTTADLHALVSGRSPGRRLFLVRTTPN